MIPYGDLLQYKLKMIFTARNHPGATVIPPLNEEMARAEHLKAATLAPAGLRSSVRFQITRPGRRIFPMVELLFFMRGFYSKKR
jgi:hypothetical protein